MLLKVKDNPDLVKDSRSNAVLNNDNAGLQAYKLRKANQRTIEQVRAEQERQRADIDTIKQLLMQLVEQTKTK